MPVTPASRQFHAWLDAVNSEDERRLRQFIEDSCSSLPNRRALSGLAFGRSGGYDLRSTEKETETHYVGLVVDRIHGFFLRIGLEVERQEPWPLTSFTVQSVSRPAGSAPRRLSEADALAALRDYLAEQTEHDHFSGTVLVAKGGTEVFAAAYGLADRERHIPNGIDTLFQTASMGKMFTAVSVLQLVQRGRVTLAESLGYYVPEWPNTKVAGSVTIHHLLTHTSGIAEVYGPGFDALRGKIATLDDYIRLFGDRELEFAPGSDWAYSNYGFTLLALVVERATKQDFRDYVHEHVFGPAGMDSVTYGPGEGMANHALHYYRDPRDNRWQEMAMLARIPGGGPGGAHMPVEDMKRFADALVDHRLLDAGHTQLLTTGKVKVETRGNHYAYGFQDYLVDGVRWFGHGGGGTSVNGDLRIYPESGYVVVVFANMSPPAAVRMSAFIGDRLPVS